MKTYRPHKNIRRRLSLLLCCLLVTGCLGLTVSADEGEPASTPETVGEDVGENVDEGVDEDPDEIGDEVDDENPDDPPADPELPTDDDEPAPEPPESDTFTVTFDFGKFGRVEETIEAGQTPKNVPGVPEEFSWQGYAVAEWLTESGEPVKPDEIPVTEDTVYTALLKRSVEMLLVTDEHEHIAYINGKSAEVFDPQGYLSRAEAAKLFSNLLSDKSFSYSIPFNDVLPDKWFSEPIGRMAALNIANGYNNGTFKPGASISRAEFVKMAVSLDSLVEGAECPFPDVIETHWARDYIASACAKGWVFGDNKGKFNPGSNITRAEAVTIINRILNRKPDEDIDKKQGARSFCDVFPSHWAYGNIIEAATEHEFTIDENGTEQWGNYTQYPPSTRRGWLTLGSKRYYIGSDGKFLRGTHTINGVKYRFDNTGVASTGFFTEGGWTRYYKNGVLVEDISNLGVVKGPYYIKVYKPANYLIVFAKDSSGKYTIPVRSMLTSCGEPTPTGNFYTPDRYRWLEMAGGSWAQWCTQIEGNYLFHSVPNDLRNNYTMWSGEFNNLGTTRSLGCIRLTCEDAKWIFDNCALGTHVYISPTETSGPLKKPAGIKIPSWHTWDPTDPTAKYLCKQHGCH